MDEIDEVLSGAEIDAIGEILNISMGSAATAISTMLEKQVIITTPRVTVRQFGKISYASLEPAMIVKIKYIEGISGSNVMVFRQSDMQIILNLLMGSEDTPSDDFVFDEMSMSAACEVMNQMMGASATALSEFLGRTINISTPEATVLDEVNTFQRAMDAGEEEIVVSVAFDLDIKGVMKSEFISIISCELARTIVNQAMYDGQDPPVKTAAVPVQQAAPAAAPELPKMAAPPAIDPMMQQVQQMQQMAQMQPQQQMPQMQQMQQQMQQQMPQMPQMPDQQYQYPYMPYPQGMPAYPGYNGYAPMQPQVQNLSSGVAPQSINVQGAQFPTFTPQATPVFSAPLTQANMGLVMNVPLTVTVEIGKTKRKIKDIIDFTQGTVIELEKQAGAPVDIVVNGQLIARGDVVVIDDNFGVRVTEIVGTKELVDLLENN